MKRIVLAPKGKRMLAALIDLTIFVFCSLLVYFTLVMPFTFDSDKIKANNVEIINQYSHCSLFLVDDNGNVESKNEFKEIKKLEDLYNVDVTFQGNKKNVSITKSLYTYYTKEHANYAGTLNYNDDNYQADVLKVGSADSNIASYDVTSHTFTLIDEKNEHDTYMFVRHLFRMTCENVSSSGKLGQLNEENNKIVITSFTLILPVLFGFSFIFYFLIPICSPFGQTIGKYIFHFIVLDKNGYHLKKGWLVLRWLTFFFLEFLGGIATVGGVFLISYTMFLFNKKRRSLHDLLSNSVVADRHDSIFFKDAREEKFFQERYNQSKGI